MDLSKLKSNDPPTEPRAFRLRDLPQEMRDIIYGMAAEDEGDSFKLKNTRRPFRGARLVSSSKIVQVSTDVHDEYQDALRVKASSPVIAEDRPNYRDPLLSNTVSTTVCDMHFSHVIDFLKALSTNDCKSFIGAKKLQISFQFTASSDGTRAELQEWLQFCRQTGVEADYRASPWVAHQGRIIQGRERATYVNIYDLFSTNDGDKEEEKVFDTLQRWFAFRNYTLPARCGTGIVCMQENEQDRAVQEGLRKSKTPAECLQTVRVEPRRHEMHERWANSRVSQYF